MSNEVRVSQLPKRDFCDCTAHYDGRTASGAWANMCEFHFVNKGVGLGTGKGQRLILAFGTPEISADSWDKEMSLKLVDKCAHCIKPLGILTVCFAIYGKLYCSEECAKMQHFEAIESGEAGEWVSTKDIGVS